MALAKTCPSIGKSNILAVYAELESVSGVLQRPTPQGYVLPTGAVNISQTPEYSNSEERSESLNIKAQFQNAVGPGDCSVPSYVRMPKDGGLLQGHALLAAMMGDVQEPSSVTCTLASEDSSDLTAAAQQITVNAVTGGFLPTRGTVQIEDERIHYTSLGNGTASGTYILEGCTRGYSGTTAAEHTDGTAVTLKSRVYYQDICRPTVSVWVRMDHAVLFGSGATVTATEIPLSKTGGQAINYTLQFRQLGWCGQSILESIAGQGVLKVKTAKDENAADGYSVGGIIKNTTKKDDNSGTGYTITAVDADAGTITVSPVPSGWAADDQLDAWLPDAEAIGIPLESRDTSVFVNGVRGKLLEGTLSIGTPTEFADEIGDQYPGENADTLREISMDTSLMFRPENITELGRGYKGYELPVDIVLGRKSGLSLAFIMGRVKFNTPSPGESGAFLTLSRTGAILENKGEDALYIVQE